MDATNRSCACSYFCSILRPPQPRTNERPDARVPLGLEPLDLALKVLGPDVDLAQLVRRLAQVLVRRVELRLEQGDLAQQALVGRLVRARVGAGLLVRCRLALGLLERRLGRGQLVLQRRDLLLALKQLLVGFLGVGQLDRTYIARGPVAGTRA